MKERPILFSGPMVRAILDGRKTQTRRLIRDARGAFWDHASWTPTVETTGIRWTTDGYESFMPLRCPYGVPGDRLWVKETYCPVVPLKSRVSAYPDARFVQSPDGDDLEIWYRADGEMSVACAADPEGPRWKSSLYMPRWASRITLEVTEVRVQRLQEISEEDAKAEGVERQMVDGCGCWVDYQLGDGTWCNSARGSFLSLWDSINGERAPWESNPFCWAISFRRVV